MSKAKGGTGRGTDKKGWNRWQASAKAKSAKRVFSKNKGADSAKGNSGNINAAKGGNPEK
ncbi:DUF3934 domain-containing protein [Paenibacillus prosopidis]|uniref:Uncharacterized protein DUF3934 n=1 Tax=Paenibacillus prosopidis TaxID=630520 RepID=A0A368W1Q0_9BACL|nr:DUF3934 domain-containing protein [Paenibacillus prosopidis]RCW48531.1 uncharacterized protein DUF3934 [Paenibacillus prosopidis]